MNKPQSLRTQLLFRLTLPLLLVVFLDALVSYWVTSHYANLAYDRWLLDSAKSLAQEVKPQDDRAIFELPPIANELFRWDDMDETFFKVESEIEGFMAGDAYLPSPSMAHLVLDEAYFLDGEFNQLPVRIVSVLTKPSSNSGNVLISVGETLTKRTKMMHEILLAVILPQLLLIMITGYHIWTGVKRGLTPLNKLSRLIGQRSAKEFSPIDDDGIPLEVRVLTDTINDLLQRLGSTLISQQRFIENAAHQLRTPLAGLKLQAERALNANSPEAMKQALTHIKNAADRVDHLNTQLLVLARSESLSQSKPEFIPVNLTQLARSCCQEWAAKAIERNIDLGFDAAEADLYIQGDAVLLQEMLSNLLDNAIRYGYQKGQINVQISPHPVKITVTDDGPGIAPEERSRVFERFYRMASSPGQGCGLGLAIVKEIADLHSAQITLNTLPGVEQGTQIEIVFGSV